jgi:FMN phosphatase YigB (HAD superfamily)
MTRRPSNGPNPVVFLLDVDNTLLDNDRAEGEYRRVLERECGPAAAARYWSIFEALRQELGYADYLGALQRYRLEDRHDPRVIVVATYLLDYPFADLLYPRALEVVRRLSARGPTVLLTDGDVVFQPRKIERSGLWRAVDGHILIYVHKEQELEDVARRYPAAHYVLVDDKLRILTAVKRRWGPRVTTIWPRQGHYAHEPGVLSAYPPPDVTLEHIGDLLDVQTDVLLAAAEGERR